MKTCEKCGARNPSRAAFCSNCGEKYPPSAPEQKTDRARRRRREQDERSFDEAPGRSARTDAQLDVQSSPVASRSREIAVVERPALRDEKLSETASAFGASLWGLFVATVRLIARLLRPLFVWIASALRETVVKALSPSSSWAPDKIPNFLYWGLVQCLVWRLPFSVVGIVDAVLANNAREEGDTDRARRLAESAKNWLLVDFCVGLVVAVFKNLVAK